jgi:hypothetical protein
MNLIVAQIVFPWRSPASAAATRTAAARAAPSRTAAEITRGTRAAGSAAVADVARLRAVADAAKCTAVSAAAATIAEVALACTTPVADTAAISNATAIPDTATVSYTTAIPDTAAISNTTAIPDTATVSHTTAIPDTVARNVLPPLFGAAAELLARIDALPLPAAKPVLASLVAILRALTVFGAVFPVTASFYVRAIEIIVIVLIDGNVAAAPVAVSPHRVAHGDTDRK